jgi:hypothetical protein
MILFLQEDIWLIPSLIGLHEIEKFQILKQLEPYEVE